MYVNTYVIAVPADRKDDYLRFAQTTTEVAKDFGALEIFENWELEVPDGKRTDYRRAVAAEANERIVVSWIVWPDRVTAAIAHKGMFEDPRLTALSEIPFDGARMIMGGFEPLIHFHKDR